MNRGELLRYHSVQSTTFLLFNWFHWIAGFYCNRFHWGSSLQEIPVSVYRKFPASKFFQFIYSLVFVTILNHINSQLVISQLLYYFPVTVLRYFPSTGFRPFPYHFRNTALSASAFTLAFSEEGKSLNLQIEKIVDFVDRIHPILSCFVFPFSCLY